MAWLTKSRFLSGLQCEKRLWLESYDPMEDEPKETSGIIHGRIFDLFIQQRDPGHIISRDDGLLVSIARTKDFIDQAKGDFRVYQPAFSADGLASIADVLIRRDNQLELVEAKATTSVQDIHVSDAAFQSLVLQRAGVVVDRVYIAHVNNLFVLERLGAYEGLVTLVDVTREVIDELPGVSAQVLVFQRILDRDTAPEIAIGTHCHAPYPCPFLLRCSSSEPPAPDFPVELLPKGRKIVDALLQEGHRDLREVPIEFLESEVHRRVHEATTTGIPYFNESATVALRQVDFPRAYLDFETISFVVPEVLGTQPYEQIPFQWSLHVEGAPNFIEHFEYLAIEDFGDFEALSSALVTALPASGTVFAYNASFERRILLRLAAWAPRYSAALQAAAGRLFDLLPVTREAYYHRDMMGSWSIKSVMPTIDVGLRYEHLGEVLEGDGAQQAFRELRHPGVSPARAGELRAALLRYCKHDTEVMVVLRRFLCSDR